ncbi:MAG: GAF domain-containing protein, partial [Anaerolineales bacterium]|nr:GAF domain-containing protein [Anaerolineales bacterium]
MPRPTTQPPPPISRDYLDFSHLTLQSTLADLPTHDYQVGGQTMGVDVAAEFERRPELPGVIILEGESLIGAFSRRQFLERVGRPYGVEVYLNRTVKVMSQNIPPSHLVLQSDRTILEAANIALARPTNAFDEPLVLIYPHGRLCLLDIYVLIMAQNHLLNLVNQIEQNRRQLAESLQRIGRELSSSLSLKKVTKRILKELDKVVMYERAVVLLEKEEMLQAIAKRGYPADIHTADLHIPIQDRPDDIYRRMALTGDPILIQDVQTDASWQQMDGLPLHRSWLGVPLMHQERVIGMVSLTRAPANAFTADDITLVLAFAGQAAVALENARLYDEIRHFNGQLEEMVAQRTLELNKALEILARLDRTKSDFINVMAHELRTPITVISGYSQML